MMFDERNEAGRFKISLGFCMLVFTSIAVVLAVVNMLGWEFVAKFSGFALSLLLVLLIVLASSWVAKLKPVISFSQRGRQHRWDLSPYENKPIRS